MGKLSVSAGSWAAFDSSFKYFRKVDTRKETEEAETRVMLLCGSDAVDCGSVASLLRTKVEERFAIRQREGFSF